MERELRMSRAQRGGIVIALAFALVLAACDGGDSATPSPTATQAEASPTPSATTPPEPEPVAFATVVPDDIEGLTLRTDSVQGDPYRYFATHPEIAGFPVLGDTLNTAIADERARFEGERGPFEPVPPGATGPSFNASFDFLVASGDVLGVHLLFYEFYGANGIERSAIYWFDLATGEALPPTALLDGDAGFDAVAEALRTVLQAEYGPQLFPDALDRVLAAPEEFLHAIAFAADGSLVVVFDEYSIGPGALGRVTVALPGSTVEPHLSDFGRRIRDETVAPSGPVRIPTPTSTPTPGPTSVATPPASSGVDCGAVACVALTFDDGPSGPTVALLDLLAEADVPATFFVVGVNARLQGALLARMADEGHEIGNHTFDHKDLTTLSPQQAAGQWSATAAIVEAATGTAPALFRPPYGANNEAVRAAIAAPFILWSVDPRDWADRDAAVVAQRVLESTRAGDIVLLHDIHRTSVEAVPAIIEGLQARGFTLVTVSTLLGDPVPGRVYNRR